MMCIEVMTSSHVSETIEWHIDETLKMPAIDHVIEVQADGDELTWVMNHFSNLPQVYGKRVVRYPQPWASFIVCNMNTSFREVTV